MPDLAAGLYLIATPIGSARDITLRALDILRDADVLAAEDTRTLRRLMEIHGVPLRGRPMVAYHDHNGPAARPKILAHLSAGRSVAYASEAGSPLIADPGYALARDVRAGGYLVTTAPGPSAALAALSLSGLPTDRFLFNGFLPAAKGARRSELAALARVPATLVFFEAPQRCLESVREMLSVLGDREAALCRELTKRFEEVRQGTLSDMLDGLETDPPRGEIVIVVDRDRSAASEDDIDAALVTALATMSVKDAAQMVSEAVGAPRRDVYQRALALGRTKR